MQLWNTLLVCGLVAQVPVQTGELPRNIRETIDYVQALQTPGGGFLAAQPREGSQPGQPSLRATTAGLRALKYFGGKVKNEKLIQDFVARCYDDKAGGFADVPGGKVEVFTTAVGLMAVVDLGLPVEKYRDGAVKFLEDNARGFEDIRIAAAALESARVKSAKAKEWFEEIRKLQNPDGTFGQGAGKARLTGAAVATILRLGGTLEQRENVLKAMKEGQQPNGGFGAGKAPGDASLAISYQVMRAFHMLKAVPDDVEGLRTFVEKCRNEDGGYSNVPAESPAITSTTGATYYAAILHFWLKGK